MPEIKGYRELTPEELEMINAIKAHEASTAALMERVHEAVKALLRAVVTAYVIGHLGLELWHFVLHPFSSLSQTAHVAILAYFVGMQLTALWDYVKRIHSESSR